MMEIRKIGYVTGISKGSQVIKKTGYILTKREEIAMLQPKIANVTFLRLRGFTYYQVVNNDDACDICQSHGGAIYPISHAKVSDNLPPFHLNCKCTIEGYSNPNDDPWKAEIILWLEIMYSNLSIEQKAQRLIDLYKLTEFSLQFVVRILYEISNIDHIVKRMEAFFSRLGNEPSRTPAPALSPFTITPEQLKAFGWNPATQEEADRLMAAFAKYGITSRESIIQFLATAAAESGYGMFYLEGDYMSEEALIRYLAGRDYGINDRGAGYIQLTGRDSHLTFLEFIGDDFRGEDTASYIAKHYPLEAAMWFWSKKNLYGYEGLNEFIETKMDEGGDLFLTFLKTSYYVVGMPTIKDENGKTIRDPYFNTDINDAIAGKTKYQILEDTLWINGRNYPLPNGWESRLEAYEKAQEIW